ncbi:MAG: MCE family protein [Ignavibacteria bacterium]|nr:MCE family protein [Ignavibacteria bacterium]
MGLNKSKYIKLGIFIVLGLALFLFAIFYVGGKDNLFTKTFDIHAVFQNVSGLTQGNSVQFAGINVGTIKSIEIMSSDKVKVNMSIVNKVKEFIKKDSEASINSDGLVGNKVLSISSGTPSSPSIENGDSLHALKPLSIGDIMDNLNQTTKDAENLTRNLSQIIEKVNNGDGTIGKLINNSDIFNNLDSLMANFAGSSKNINKILTQASGVIESVSQDIAGLNKSIVVITQNIEDITGKINSSESLVGTLLTDTVFAQNIKMIVSKSNSTAENLEMGSFSFYQNMEALKHNFLFKGYFEDIGYWDKATFEKSMDDRETRILNKEHDLDKREVKLRTFQIQLDSLRNILDEKLDSLNFKK